MGVVCVQQKFPLDTLDDEHVFEFNHVLNLFPFLCFPWCFLENNIDEEDHPTTTIILHKYIYIYILYSPRCRLLWSSSICPASSSNQAWRYDVFVSFRGQDTRYKFTDHLFAGWTGAGFTALKITESLREGKISGPSQRRQYRSPGLLLQSFRKTMLIRDGVSKSWGRSWNANGICNKLCCPFSTRFILPTFEIRRGVQRKRLSAMRSVLGLARWTGEGCFD